jgi:putative lysine transport system ATP-binding protein
MNILQAENVTKSFDGVEVLHQLSVGFKQGTVTTIIGPSGSGKSTFLRTLNQLEELDYGAVYFQEQDITKKETNLNHVRSQIGMVFQSFHLFHNMTVLENCTIGQIKVLKRTPEEAKKRALLYLQKVGMAEFAERKASQLSGGQKQRVAIARTLSMDASIILFDEPTSSLDPEMVGEVLEVMKDIMKEDLTCIVVTHEMDFAKEVSDRIIFMDQGSIVLDGTVKEVFENESIARIEQFLNRIR